MKLLILSDSPFATTGYSQVVNNLITHSEFEISCIGSSHFGSPVNYNGATIYGRGEHQKGYDVLPYVIAKEKPDYVITMYDIGWQRPYGEIIKKFKKTKWLAYVPFDSLCALDWQKECLDKADMVISMSKYGQKKLSELELDAKHIPLGCDTNLYKPKKVANLKRILGSDNKFVVLSVGMNMIRKGWDRLLKGFGLFAKDKENVLFLLHTDMLPSDELQGGYDMSILMKKYGIEDKCMFTDSQQTRFWRNQFPEERMIELYNLSDVGIYAGAEGFGLPMVESMACGKPVIVGDQTSAEELVGNHGIRVSLEGYHCGKAGVEFGIPSASAIGEALNIYYTKPELRKKYGLESRKHACNYSWDKTVKQWEELLQ